eukprot:m.101068 g.101068  ORF g.101068 m.101068 type:complete len:393 (-) comp15436_c0_seq2:184-1362(-)
MMAAAARVVSRTMQMQVSVVGATLRATRARALSTARVVAPAAVQPRPQRTPLMSPRVSGLATTSFLAHRGFATSGTRPKQATTPEQPKEKQEQPAASAGKPETAAAPKPVQQPAPFLPKSKHSKVMRLLEAEPNPETPHLEKPLVVMIGWLGAKDRHLRRYRDWYLNRHMDVLQLLTPADYVINTDKGRALTKHLVDVLYTGPHKTRPIVIHGFSVGGFLHALTTGELLKHAGAAERIRCQLFDSPVDVQGLPHGVSVSLTDNLFLRKVIRKMLGAFLVLAKKRVADYHIASVLFHANPLRTPSHVFYSSGDPIACPDRIAMATSSFNESNVPVTLSRWHESPHVRHMPLYPDNYFRDMGDVIMSYLPEYFPGQTINAPQTRDYGAPKQPSD